MTPELEDPFGSKDGPTEYEGQGRKPAPGFIRSAWCVALAAAVLTLFVVWLLLTPTVKDPATQDPSIGGPAGTGTSSR